MRITYKFQYYYIYLNISNKNRAAKDLICLTLLKALYFKFHYVCQKKRINPFKLCLIIAFLFVLLVLVSVFVWNNSKNRKKLKTILQDNWLYMSVWKWQCRCVFVFMSSWCWVLKKCFYFFLSQLSFTVMLNG